MSIQSRSSTKSASDALATLARTEEPAPPPTSEELSRRLEELGELEARGDYAELIRAVPRQNPVRLWNQGVARGR